MKTILIPTEDHDTMPAVLTTAKLIAQTFDSYMEGFAIRPAVGTYVTVEPVSSLAISGAFDEDTAREAIGKLDVASVVSAGVRMIGELTGSSAGEKVGAVGFCWGGAYVNRLAVAAGGKLAAAVPFYGPAPDPAEAVKVKAPMQFHLAGLDARVAETAWPWIGALGKEGKLVEAFVYPGVNHAFHNDTSAERYDKAAATLAWARTLDFFKRFLA